MASKLTLYHIFCICWVLASKPSKTSAVFFAAVREAIDAMQKRADAIAPTEHDSGSSSCSDYSDSETESTGSDEGEEGEEGEEGSESD